MTFITDRVFAGKSVFITGHTGLKGSWLCLWLERLGARVTGYALAPPTQPNLFTLAEVHRGLAAHHEADIRDRARLRDALASARPEIVLHLAAQSVVRLGYAEPFETFEVNTLGTASLLESVRQLGQPCVVVCVTSDKCYQNVEQVWGYREHDAMGGGEPYSGSKGAAELVIGSYRDAFFPPADVRRHGVRLASARAGNVIGGGDWTPHALIVDVVQALSHSQPVRLRSPGANRPWQHVLQCLSGYLTLAARLLQPDSDRYCSAWNFGPLPGSEVTVRELVQWFLREWGAGDWRDASDPQDLPEASILRLCIDKALWQLGWRPGWDVRQAVRQTARWYCRYNQNPLGLREFTLGQIAEFEQDFQRIQSIASEDRLQQEGS